MYKIKDKYTYNFWVTEEDIPAVEMERFIKDKIFWNMGKIKMSQPEIDRLIAFQHACNDKGLTDRFRQVEKKIIKNLSKKRA